MRKIKPLEQQKARGFSYRKSSVKSVKVTVMRVAVASTDGEKVDSCFEMADTFFIFDIEGEKKVFIERRDSQRYSISIENKRFKRNRFIMVVDVIKDCSRVYIETISDIISSKLNEYGIKARTYSGKILNMRVN